MKKSDLSVSNLTKNFNEALILSILFLEPKHGYQIALEIEEKSEGLFKFNHGTLYPILHKLEKEGLIKGDWEADSPKRKRKFYAITSIGKKHMKNQYREWENLTNHFFNIIGEVNK
ncbi:MAG: PadR family transcriptional regulator [Melioribacteraceae bacterium]|nr:MAG: PadR family transcriptional regulator [Melioribacteraceae bacterium]